MSKVSEQIKEQVARRGNEDPRQRKRTVPMEVVSAGYSRTGTMTIRAAFGILGINTWHWIDQAANPPDMDMWSDTLLAKFDPEQAARQGIKPYSREEFDMLLSNFGGTSDAPAAILVEELINAYPDLKVVLHERDEEKWFKSYKDTVIDGIFTPLIPLAGYLDPVFMRRACHQTNILMKYYFEVPVPRANGIFNNSEAYRMYCENAREAYRRHNAMVKRVVPKEKLLLFKLEEGWGPLCEFLGKPVPDVPFPRLNETAEVQERIQAHLKQSYKSAAMDAAKKVAPAAVLLIAACVWWWMG